MFHAHDPNSDMPTTERILAVLLESYLGKGYCLFTGNFCTSPSLAKFFLDNKTHLAGTIRVNQYNFPKDIMNEPLEKGATVFYINTDNPMTACKYTAD